MPNNPDQEKIKQIKKAVVKLSKARNQDSTAEGHLVFILREYLKKNEGKSLAKALGISPQYLSDIIKMRRAITHPVLMKFRKMLNLPNSHA